MRNMSVRKVCLRVTALAVAAGLAMGVLPLAVSDSASAAVTGQTQPASRKATTPYCDRSVFSFVDVPWNSKFWREISWLTCQGISRGTPVEGEAGHFLFKPKEPLTREAMAAFLFRLHERNSPKSDPPYQAPGVSPFDDVQPGDSFYREITWMHESGISTGTIRTSGKPLFKPKQTLSREAMAAFLFRHQRLQGEGDRTKGFVAPKSTRFADIAADSKFYRQIAWMDVAKVSTGVKMSGGTEYQPKGQVTREAMAAFLYRLFK